MLDGSGNAGDGSTMIDEMTLRISNLIVRPLSSKRFVQGSVVVDNPFGGGGKSKVGDCDDCQLL